MIALSKRGGALRGIVVVLSVVVGALAVGAAVALPGGLVYLAGGAASVAAFSVSLATRRYPNPAWFLAAAMFIDAIVWLADRLELPAVAAMGAVLVVIPVPFAAAAILNERIARRAIRLPEVGLSMALVAFAALSLSWSDNDSYGTEKLALFLFRGLIPGLGILVLASIKRPSWNVILAAATGYGLLVLLWGEVSLLYPGRWTIGSANPIWVARAALLPATLAIWTKNSSRGLRVSAFSVSILVAWRAQSRGPVVAFVAAVLIGSLVPHLVSFLRGTRSRGMGRILVLLLLGGLVLVGVVRYAQSPGERLTALGNLQEVASDPNITFREGTYVRAIEAIRQDPLVGSGLGGFSATGEREYPHNILLELGVELGVVGVLLWLALATIWTWRARTSQLLLSLVVQSVLYAMVSGDLAFNGEHILIGMLVSSSVFWRDSFLPKGKDPLRASTDVRGQAGVDSPLGDIRTR